MKFNSTVRGEYKLSVLRRGVEVESTPWRPNLITDAGMDSLGLAGSNSAWAMLAVGTGTTPPQFTDTALAAQVAQTGNGGFPNNGIVSGNTCTHTGVFTFPLGGVVGNISELGIRGVASGSLFTRALVTDGSGNPTSVTVTAADQLVVTYRVVFTVDQSIQTATVVDPNSSISYTIRCGYEGLATGRNFYGMDGSSLGTPVASGNNYSIVGGDFGGPGTSPTGGSPQSISFATGQDQSDPYVPGSFQRNGRLRFPAASSALDRDNIDIMRIRTYTPSEYVKFHFDPPFRKPSTFTCELGWAVSWGRG